MKIDITSGNDDTLVTFNNDRTANNSQTFTVTAGQKSHDVTVYIINNNTDAADNNQKVEFTLSEGSNFPSGWGRVSAGSETFTLTVLDDDDNQAGSPLCLPDPTRPPIQETSPKPSDEFQKEANANP